MILIRHNPTGELSLVDSIDGYDEPTWTVLDANAVNPNLTGQMYDATGTLVARPLTPGEETAAALEADPRWQAMKTASQAQVEAWLTANVTDLASARRVLKILVLAIQRLARTR